MPSDDHNETFDNVTVEQTITDPTGTQYESLGGGGGSTADVRVTGDRAASEYTATDPTDGSVIDTGSDATQIIDSAVAALPDRASDERHARLALTGTFSLPSTWVLGDPWVWVDARNAALDTTSDHNLFDIQASHVRVTGGTWDGHQQAREAQYRTGISAGREVEDIHIDRVRVRNCGYYGVNFHDVTHASLTNSALVNNSRLGYHNGADREGWGTHIRVQNVYAQGTNTGAAFDDRGTTDASTRLDNTYINCWSVATANTGDGAGGFAFTTYGPEDSTFTIRNCWAVEPTSQDAFYLANATYTITASGARSPTMNGFHVYDDGQATTATIRECAVTHAGGSGIATSGDVTARLHDSQVGSVNFNSLDASGRVVVGDSDVATTVATANVWVDGYATSDGEPAPSDYQPGLVVRDTTNTTTYVMGPNTAYPVSAYEIQKDGTDGAGIINFHTQ